MSVDDLKCKLMSLRGTPVSFSSCAHPRPPLECGADMTRLLQRISEFEAGCPICFEEEHQDLRVMGCCGYVLCGVCCAKLSRCPFCRKSLTAADAEATASSNQYPERFPLSVQERDSCAFEDLLEAYTDREASQLQNLVTALHLLFHYQYRRILIVLDCGHGPYSVHTPELDLGRLSEVTGYRIGYVDELRGARSSIEFEEIKRQFESQYDESVRAALVTTNAGNSVMTGTDFCNIDALVVGGTIPDETVIQALGRIFRPSRGRDNSKAVRLIKVCTSQAAHRNRRPRIDR